MVGNNINDSSNLNSQLVCTNISFAWNSSFKALDNCSFSIPGPGLWMLVGKNGSGKSTLFRLLSGMLKPQEGNIHCSLKSALMFQNPDHQLLLPTCKTDLLLSVPKDLDASESKNLIEAVLGQVGMAGMEDRPIHTLSGGQKQRLALAGALASQANLLLLDEPTALLDPNSQRSVLTIVKKLTSSPDRPITVLWITHRLEELFYCNGAARMENGRIEEWQSGEELFQELTPLAGR